MKRLIILFIGIGLFSCQSNQKSEVAVLKDSVMYIHDQVMPKMGELMKTSKALKAFSDSLGKSDSLRAELLRTAANDIDVANENMMVWMRNYEPAYEGTEEEILAYLQEQKKAIQEVKDDMEGSLTKGKELLEE